MKPVLLILFLLAAGIVASPAAESDDPDVSQPVARKYVLVLGSHKGFPEARRQALAIGHASKTRFSSRGMVYDKKRGLILPDNDPDGIYAGSYVSRRCNTDRVAATGEQVEYLSVERSDAYEGFRPGYYIVVGGIYDDAREAAKATARYKPIAADAYAKQTKIYLGCIH